MKETFDQRLKRLRLAKGWSLSQLGNLSQLSEKILITLETESHVIPKWNTIRRLASALDTNAFYLASGDGDDKPFHVSYRNIHYRTLRSIDENCRTSMKM
jgi:transcriptional regulator with XRE-family HTH domain